MKLEDFKVFELRDIVRKYNKHVKIAGFSSMKKTELISALRNHPRLEIKEGGEKISIDIKPLKNIGENIKNADKKPKKTKEVKKDDPKVSEPVKQEGGGKPAQKSKQDKRLERLAFMRKKKAEKAAQLPGKKLKKVTKEDISDLGKEKKKFDLDKFSADLEEELKDPEKLKELGLKDPKKKKIKRKKKIPSIKVTDAEPTTYKELDSKEKVEQFKLPKPSVKKLRVAPKKKSEEPAEKEFVGKAARDAERDRLKKIISKKLMIPLSGLKSIKRLDQAQEELERIEKGEKEEKEFEDKYLDGLIRGGPRSKQIVVIEKIFKEYGSRDKETQEGLFEELEKFRINIPKSKQARTDFFDDLSKLEQQLFKLQNSRMYNEFLLPVKKRLQEEKKKDD